MALKRKTFYFNNSSESGQSFEKFAVDVMQHLFENEVDEIVLAVDDGDGDTGLYTLDVSHEWMKGFVQCKEN